MNFEFATANRIIFGRGTGQQVPKLAVEMGQRPLVVIGRNTDRVQPLLEALRQIGLTDTIYSVTTEPSVETIVRGVQQARQAACDLIIGFGGGSVIDAGKAIAALLTNPGQVLDYLEVIGQGKTLSQRPAPYIAIPTTAGTGAEVTRNAVLASPEHRVKVSLRSPLMLPDVAVVDPELTYAMPPAVTASTGLDALTQVMEPYVSNQANPLTDALSQAGLRRAARSLRRAYQGGDIAAREDMALASLCGGLALANAKLGAVHGFAGVLGGIYDVPHGVICARLLPYTMAVNVRALQMRAAASPALQRYADIAQILTGQPTATAADGVRWIHDICTDLAISPLAEFGLTETDFPTIIEKSQKASSMKGNPLPLTDDELVHILKQAM